MCPLSRWPTYFLRPGQFRGREGDCSVDVEPFHLYRPNDTESRVSLVCFRLHRLVPYRYHSIIINFSSIAFVRCHVISDNIVYLVGYKQDTVNEIWGYLVHVQSL